MNPNDKIASGVLSSKVGTLRYGAHLSNELDSLFRGIESESKIGRRIVGSLANKIGSKIEDDIDAFAERRLDTLFKRINDATGGELKRPRSPGSISMFRGSIEKFMDKAASRAKDLAPRLIKEGADHSDAFKQMRSHARTISRSAANSAHNAAVLAIARANKNVIQAVVAMATLDDRTTKHICVPRHGGAWDVTTKEALPWSSISIPFPGRPPWHFNCRTTLSAVLRDEAAPTEHTKELDRWIETEDAESALGADRIELYRNGIITRTQLTSQDGRPIPLSDLR